MKNIIYTGMCGCFALTILLNDAHKWHVSLDMAKSIAKAKAKAPRTKDTARKDKRRKNDDKYMYFCVHSEVGVDFYVDGDVGVDEVNGWEQEEHGGAWRSSRRPAAKGLKMYRNQVNCLQDVKKVKPLENVAEESAS